MSVVSRINKLGPRTAAEALCSDSVYQRHKIAMMLLRSTSRRVVLPVPIFHVHLWPPQSTSRRRVLRPLSSQEEDEEKEISGRGIIEKYPHFVLGAVVFARKRWVRRAADLVDSRELVSRRCSVYSDCR